MVALFRWLVRGLVAAGLLAALGLALVYYLASNSLPDYDGNYTVEGLNGPVEIVRNNHAVPHIFSAAPEGGDEDVLFGLGFVHAQDRLWQMMLMRRTVQGRLSEVFGEETLEIDHLLRALDLYPLSVKAVSYQSDETLARLDAYSRGVNAYLALVQEEALGRGAPEFFLFRAGVAPWTAADSIAIQKLMALQLTDMAQREILRAELALRVDPERVDDLMPVPDDAKIALPEFAQLLPARDYAALPPHPLSPLRDMGETGASNAFAASAARAAANAPLLASDPHLALQAPSFWMLARLELSTGAVIGGTIPGLPGVLIGRSERLAWGLTTSYLDDQDIFIERLNPGSPDEYATPTGFAPFESRETVIAIKGAAPVTKTLRWSRHGPVIPPPHFGAESITPDGHVAALAWTALTQEDRSLEGLFGIMEAGNVYDAIKAMEPITAPSQNLMLADQSRIAFKALGRAPKRNPKSVGKGMIPVGGWRAENDWEGFFPYASNPVVTAPASGILVNTNNRITRAPYPRHWSHSWGDSHRIQRAELLLNARGFHTLDSFIGIQNDTVSPAARALLPLIARNLWYRDAPATSDLARQRQEALEALALWNGEMTQHGPEPLIYAAWLRELQNRVVKDEIGPLAEKFARPVPLFLERVFRDEGGAGIWCDIRQSDKIETCEEIASTALDAALLTLSDRYGPRLQDWRWGTAHQAVHRHQALGRVPGLSWLTNIRQETPGGDFTLLRGQTPARGAAPFENVHGSGLRIVVDFADPEASQMIISTGQSGHFLSRHYDDQALLWRRSAYIPMALDPELARGGAVGITRLAPAP